MVDISTIGSVIGEPARARMLLALMDGRALTATELSLAGGVTASTASSHLARLTESGLVTVAKQGRHRYYRIATTDVAAALETLMTLGTTRRVATGPRDEALRRARVCYDHLAGESAVRMLDRMRAKRLLRGDDDALALTSAGEAWCVANGIDVAAMRARRRPICKPCLDWSERRNHLAGALGNAIFDRLVALRFARREPDTRAVHLSPRGEAFVEHLELRR